MVRPAPAIVPFRVLPRPSWRSQSAAGPRPSFGASGVAMVRGGGGSSCRKHASGVTTRRDVQDHIGRMNAMGQGLGTGGFDHCPAGDLRSKSAERGISGHGAGDVDHLPVAAGPSVGLALDPAQGRRRIPVLGRRGRHWSRTHGNTMAHRAGRGACAPEPGCNGAGRRSTCRGRTPDHDGPRPDRPASMPACRHRRGSRRDDRPCGRRPGRGSSGKRSTGPVPDPPHCRTAGGRSGRRTRGRQASRRTGRHGAPGSRAPPRTPPGSSCPECRGAGSPWHGRDSDPRAFAIGPRDIGERDCRPDPCRRRSCPPPSSLDRCSRTNGDQGPAVVDPAGTGAAEEGERPVVRIEHRLLRLARTGPDERHPAVAQAEMGDLGRHGHAIEDHDLMAPVDLAGLARIEARRHIGTGRGFLRRLRPTARMAPDSIMAAVMAAVAQLRADPRIGVGRPRLGRRAFSPGSSSSSDRQGSIFGRGCVVRSYANPAAPDPMTLRTLFRDNRTSRQTCLID
ncbi:hypothetical protein ROA7023_04698 [Roseisalinus antarcticus]|uniref:Uncharacterized protein n=1 Tax=Roseisalinus antarcticus TaxID=254357 RepID=A0A1Y5U0N5_9RHOB|nr:hypothetical protein ROA7023_04698 [Roseisalinus antarcticus]